jgi:NADH-quinone oxidoreductase subunit G
MGADVALVGEAVDLTYDYTHLGTDRAALAALLNSAKPSDAEGIVIIGQGALREADGAAVLAAAMALCDATGARLLVLHTAAAGLGLWISAAPPRAGSRLRLKGPR